MAVEPTEISQQEYNQKVKDWGSKLGSKIRSSISTLATKGKGDLLKSLKTKSYEFYGEVDRIAYHFERHGVFWHKGVGRGYRMVGGKVMRVSGSLQGQFVKEYAKVKNRAVEPRPITGVSMLRKSVEWFNPVISDNISELADLVAGMDADRVVNATKILIK